MKHRSFRPQFVFVIALCSVLLGALIGAYFHKETVVVRVGTADTPAAMTSVNLMVDHGDGTIKTWNTISWHESMSILNLLETVAGAKEIVLTTKDDTKKGLLVESMDGFANMTKGTSTTRWQFWINNTYEPRVASKYYLRPGDMVMWKYFAEQTK